VTPPPQRVGGKGSQPGEKGWAVVVVNLKTNRKEFMKLLNTKDKDKIQNPETENSKPKDIHRIIISKDAKLALDDLLKKSNEGFDAGEISKSDIVNMLLINAPKYMTDADIKNLRALHFDEAKVLAAMLKGVAQGEQLPETLKSALRTQYGFAEGAKRKTANSSPKAVSDINEIPGATPQQ
jgi:hypothetical protein